MNNNIFYIDMDSLYASVEELCGEKTEPLLIPMDCDKSIIVSAIYLASKLLI